MTRESYINYLTAAINAINLAAKYDDSKRDMLEEALEIIEALRDEVTAAGNDNV